MITRVAFGFAVLILATQALAQWQDMDGNDWQTPIDQNNADDQILRRRTEENRRDFDSRLRSGEEQHRRFEDQFEREQQDMRRADDSYQQRQRTSELEDRMRRFEYQQREERRRQEDYPFFVMPPSTPAIPSAPDVPKKQARSSPTWVPPPPANYKGFHEECQAKAVMTEEDMKRRRAAIDHGDC